MRRTKLFLVAGAMLLASVAFGQDRATGYIKPTPEARAAAYKRDHARNGARVAQIVKMTAPPPKFDCVEMGWCPPIRDQGNCGSCYGVATADQLTCAFIKAGYQRNDDSFEINFQFGLDRCGPNFGGCNGGWGAEVAEWMIANGFPAERWVDANGKTVNDYPAYTARPSSCREKSGAKRWKPVEMGFCSGSSSRAATVAEIKACLMQYGVVNIAFNANSAYSNAGPNSVVRVSGGANHETTLVGWDDSKNNNKGAWKTRGNWGTGLGDGGYVWFTYDSTLEDPFWLVATPLPPVPPDPGPTPPVPPIPPAPGNLTITPAVITLPLGGTQQFTVTPAASYVWSASGGTVDQEGKYTAPKTAGNYTVSANVPGDPTRYAIARVTVADTPQPLPGVQIIISQNIPPGTYQLVPVKPAEPMPAPEPEEETPEPPPIKDEKPCCTDYEQARADAIKFNRPLVVGIGCAAPGGEWINVKVDGLHGFKGPVIVVAVKNVNELRPVATLADGATADDVRRVLRRASKYDPTK